MKKLFILSLGFILTHMTFSQDLLWSVITDTNQVYYGKHVMVDDADNVYFGADGSNTATILKYSKEGTPLFVSGDFDEASYMSMALGEDNSVYMVGRKRVSGQWEAMLMALDADGNPLFTQLYNYISKDDIYNDVKFDGEGNIYVCGNAYNANTEQCGILARYAPDGTPAWVQHFEESGRHVNFKALNISDDGKIHIMGRKSYTSPGPIEIMSMVYNSDGMLLSEYSASIGSFTESSPDFSLLDDEGNHYIGGHTMGGVQTAFMLRLTDNNLRWLHIGAEGTKFNQAYLSAEGKIFCCGEIISAGKDAYCVTFSPEGGMEKEFQYDSPYQLDDLFSDVTVSGDFVYLCGASSGLGTEMDMLCLKLNMEMETMWQIRYNSFNNGAEAATGISIDSEENILICGVSAGIGSYNFCGWKYSNPLDIDELNVNAQNMLSMYPNPAQQYLNIYIDEPAVPDLLVSIFNIRGEKVSEHNCRCDDGCMQVDVSALRPGTYFLQAATGKMQYSAKFLKD